MPTTKQQHRLSPHERIAGIGEFYTGLTIKLLPGSTRTKASYEGFGGDITLDALDAFLEVKAINNHQGGLEIFLDQFEKHLATLGFPFGHCWYMLYTYKGCEQRENIVRRTLSRSTPTRQALDQFLAANTYEAYLIDSSALEAIRAIRPPVMRLRKNEPVPVLKLPLRFMRSLELEMPHGIVRRTVPLQVRYKRRKVHFALTIMLPTGKARKVASLLRQSGTLLPSKSGSLRRHTSAHFCMRALKIQRTRLTIAARPYSSAGRAAPS